MTRLQSRVITRSMSGRPGLFAAALLVAGGLALFGSLLLSARATFLAVVEAGARVEFGGYDYQVGGDSDELSDYMRTLASHGQAVAVLRASAAVTGPRATSDVQAYALSGPSRSGLLVQGEYPAADGEASISVEVARRTGLHIGDHLELTAEDMPAGARAYTVTGVTRNPSATGDLTATVIVGDLLGNDGSGVVSSWLSNTNPCEQIRLEQQCGSGAVTTAGIDQAVRAATQEVSSRRLAGFPVLVVLLLLSAGAGCGAALAAHRPRVERVAGALRAAGATPRRAQALAGAAMPLTLIIGSVLGIILAQVVLGVGYGSIGSALGQYWAGYRPVLAQVLGLTAAWLLLAGLLGALPDRLRRWSADTRGAAWRLRPTYGVVLGAVGTIAAMALVYLRVAEPHRVLTGHVLGVILAALTTPVLLFSLPWLRRTPIAGTAVRHCLTVALPVLMVTMMFTGFASFYSANLHFGLTNGTEGQEDQTLTVQGLTAQDVSVLTAAYPQAMESAFVFTQLREDQHQPRVGPAGEASCTSALCFSALGLVALAPEQGPAAELAGTAATELLGGGAEGRATLVFFTPATDQVEETAEMTGLSPSSLLDNQWLPDVVLSADDVQVGELGLIPSTGRTIYLPHFGSLPDDRRDAFRSDVITRAGYAFVIEPDSPERRQLMRQALALPIAAGLAAMIGQGLAAITFLGRLRSVRLQARDYGADRYRQCALTVPLSVSLVVCTATASLFGRFGAQPAVLMNNPLVTGSFGWWWAMPVVASALVSAGLLVAGACSPSNGDAGV